MNPAEKIIFACDYPDLDSADRVLSQVANRVGYVKIGKQLFTAFGPRAVERVKKYGGRVFLDLKFHDIPNTVAGAVKSAASLEVDMLTIHLSGGLAMLKAARENATDRMKIIGVTVLTSLTDQDLIEIGFAHSAAKTCLKMVHLAREANIHGVVTSPQEVAALRAEVSDDFLLVTPGIRPAVEDQKRVSTPKEAVKNGADYLVIGRAISGAADAALAVEQICQEMGPDL